MDASILHIIPPIVAAILTYIVANKKARIQHAQLLADMQTKAIETVSQAEEKMRKEIWAELQKVREDNVSMKEEMEDMRNQLIASRSLSETLKQEIVSLNHQLEIYKKRVSELEKK